ncbi:MAG: hypothetical protein J7530_03205 [Novosphingobium sp.]|nr:hypothetical protein [Novosphingobium sp.]
MNPDKQTARDNGPSDAVQSTEQVAKKPNTEKDKISASRRPFELRAVAPLDPDF